MRLRVILAVLALVPLSLFTAAASTAGAAGEYSKHFGALQRVSVAVAQAMPAAEYAFRAHPESTDFAALISHIATTNYQFCAGLQDSGTPALPSRPRRTPSWQPNNARNCPDGRLLGREIAAKRKSSCAVKASGRRPRSRARAVIPRRTGWPAAVWCRIARNESA